MESNAHPIPFDLQKADIKGQLPKHIAIIMDGNGRWASEHSLTRSAGHKRGVEAVRSAVTGAAEIGIAYLTLYAFSSENWARPVEEVNDLMGLLRLYLSREIKTLDEKNVKLKVIGRRTGLANDILAMIAKAEERTVNNTGLTLIIALNYGARQEIIDCTKKIVKQVAESSLHPDEIDEKVFENNLETAGIPDPDLLIRTSGEVRLSNFLLWQLAYTEFCFLDLYWPDFTKDTLLNAIHDYLGRSRRYGARP